MPIKFDVITAQTDRINDICLLEKEVFSQPWSADEIARIIDDKYRFILCAVEGENLLGYVVATSLFETAQIDRVAVDANFRRMGVAKALISLCERECKDRSAEEMLLEVRASNYGAQALYSSLGFKSIATRKNYYQMPVEDAVVMRKTI